ncbi:phage baseplate assembly protein V family protein [Asticcacaulis biprosthecium C19]|uniref:Phage baseplate assembly protein V family protein n=1 Tax=Asticcacaulis biprosthecium C19 TaxID=715226 RepID=F4QG87_9CAUL|nr:phage baseplate assembly protein V [Asticcacaulis biprosthecium]EGF92415.1 phage baseplate assembly protein V family protein [Asticcacaulis biprosthecium C19]
MQRELDALGRKIRLLIGRCILSAIDDSGKRQLVQVQRLEGETSDDVERFTHYGFSSAPLPGCEAIAIDLAGVRSHTVIIADGDSRYRLHLVNGEVALHDDLGQKVHLKRDGIEVYSTLAIKIESTTSIDIEAPQINLTGEVLIDGDLLVDGDAALTGDIEVDGNSVLGEGAVLFALKSDMSPATTVKVK